MSIYTVDYSKKAQSSYKMYSLTSPENTQAWGLISDGCKTGVLLMHLKTGIFTRLNSGCLSSLDQKKVKDALKKEICFIPEVYAGHDGLLHS